MTSTSYEEAKRCPKCQNPGREVSSRRRRDGSELKTIACGNARCSWFDTTYVVQINADGTIPEPTLDRDKSFPALPDRTDAVQAQMQRLYEQTLRGGETS